MWAVSKLINQKPTVMDSDFIPTPTVFTPILLKEKKKARNKNMLVSVFTVFDQYATTLQFYNSFISYHHFRCYKNNRINLVVIFNIGSALYCVRHFFFFEKLITWKLFNDHRQFKNIFKLTHWSMIGLEYLEWVC